MANNTLQTLDRGLKALEIVSEHSDGISIADLAERLDIHRAIAYRIVTTLASHGLITRTPEAPFAWVLVRHCLRPALNLIYALLPSHSCRHSPEPRALPLLSLSLRGRSALC